MFLWTFDLRALLFIVLLLPLAGALLTLLMARLQRRRRQAADQAALLEPLFAQAPSGLLLFDDAHHLLQINDMARRLLQIPASATVLPDARWARLLQKDLQEVGRYRTVELALHDSDDSDSGETSIVRWWITHQQHHSLVLLFDITTEQRAEQSAHRLLSDLSHELRTPLATLLTHIEVLSLPNIADEVRQQSRRFMKDEIQRLVRMSNRTLELGQLQSSASFEPMLVALQPLVESIVSQMQVAVAAKDGRITIEADESLPPVPGDPDQLRQVFLNLLDNAIKYGENGNGIAVAIQRTENGIVCTVRDSGPGIAVEHLPHLERRFYRAAPSNVDGSGLGLAMVREILRRHNSQLKITSQTTGDERGTTMRFILPVFDEEEN